MKPSARPDDLDRLAADPADKRLVRLALKAAAREIAFLRGQLGEPLLSAPQPAAGWSPMAHPGRRIITKTHRDRLIWAGTTSDQAHGIELACLSRLSQTPGAVHFPVVTDMDRSVPSLTLLHAGLDLRHVERRGTPVPVPGALSQIERMLDAMAVAGLVHLDLHPDGRNLCVSDDGHLTLIDFDIAALDGKCLSGSINERLEALKATGDVRSTLAAQLEAMLSRCACLRKN